MKDFSCDVHGDSDSFGQASASRARCVMSSTLPVPLIFR
jgi:hypothetical protein